MKRIKIVLIGLILMIIMPFSVDAASGNISVSSSSSVVVGNTVTVTVKLSSSTKIGSWEMDLNYNSEYLKLTSTTSEGGGTSMVNSSSGTKSKTYTFKFKALKSGTTKISVPSYLVYDYDNMEEMSITTSSKSIKIMTQSELEATYSSDAYLKKLSVDDYELSPKFDKNTYEYSVEVENDVTSVKVSATENDSKATVSGEGEYPLEEGNNKIEIEVTAQKGNTLTYVVNVYRKELDPIIMEADGKSLTVVRKEDLIPDLKTFSLTTFVIDDEEVPGLKSDTTGYELLVLKDEQGNIVMYIYEDGKIKEEYHEVTGTGLVIFPLELQKSEEFSKYDIREIEINGTNVDTYSLEKKSNEVIFYGHNVLTGDYSYYVYDIENDVISVYSSELKDYYEELVEKYKYVLLGSIGAIILLMFIIILRKPRVVEVVKEVIVEKEVPEVKNEVALIAEQEVVPKKKKKKKKKKKNNNNVDTNVDNNVDNEEERERIEIKEIEIDVEDEVEEESEEEVIKEVEEELEEKENEEHLFNSMSPRDQKKLLKQQKKLLKEAQKREKARKEFDF